MNILFFTQYACGYFLRAHLGCREDIYLVDGHYGLI